MTAEGDKSSYAIRRIEAAKTNPEISLNDRALGIITQLNILSKILIPKDELREDEGRLLLLVLDSSSSMTSFFADKSHSC